MSRQKKSPATVKVVGDFFSLCVGNRGRKRGRSLVTIDPRGGRGRMWAIEGPIVTGCEDVRQQGVFVTTYRPMKNHGGAWPMMGHLGAFLWSGKNH